MVDDSNKPPWDDTFGPPPTEDELAESERLRQALDEPRSAHPDAELARALRNVVDPRPLDELSHRRLLERALPKKPRRVEIALIFAAAAAVLVAIFALAPQGAAPSAALLKPHSTEALFSGPFPREGQTSARIDAIALSRGRELRQNKWTKWGLK